MNNEEKIAVMTNHSITNLKWLELAKREVKYVNTSIEPLNKAIGGLACGQYYLICAPTNAGKSTLLQSLMIDCVKAGKKCLYIPSEDEQEGVALNVILALSNIRLSKHYKNKLTEGDYEYMEKTAEKYKDLLYIHERNNTDYEVMKKVIESYINEMGVEYIFYDYVGSIPNPKDMKEYASLMKESDVLQQLCIQKDVCVVSACQTNGNIYNTDANAIHRYSANDISGAKGLANKAKVVLFLYDENGKKMMSIWKAKRWLAKLQDNRFEVDFDPQRVLVSTKYDWENSKK